MLGVLPHFFLVLHAMKYRAKNEDLGEKIGSGGNQPVKMTLVGDGAKYACLGTNENPINKSEPTAKRAGVRICFIWTCF